MSGKQASVLGRFLETVREHGLLPEGGKVLVAVSGGADSVCLLDLLRTAQNRFRLGLAAFHLNHRLRDTAGRDEEFVRRLCREWGVKLVVVGADVRAYAKLHGLGTEEAGRELRYRHLERVARRLKCNVVALGHTADDNLETMLLNLVRGAGPRGLGGIPVRRGRYVRPLIDIEHEQVRRHLAARGIAWVEDESNQDVTFRRNLLRLQVVPVLRRLSPAAAANARRAAQLLAEESDFLDRLATAAAAHAVSKTRARVRIDIAKFRNYNNILKRRILKQVLPELDSHAVEKLLDLSSRRTGGRLSLTQGVRAHRRKGTIELERSKEILNDA